MNDIVPSIEPRAPEFGRRRKRRGSAAALLAIVAILTATTAGCKQKPAAATASNANRKLPNILLISIDTLRADRLSCYGLDRPTSPNLDRLAAEGARFTRALSNAPWTLPSHVTMFTGHEVGVHGVDRISASLAANVKTIPAALRERGYATAAVVTAPMLQAKYGLNQGLDSYDDLSPDDHSTIHLAKRAREAVDRTLEAIKVRRVKPWFVFLHLFDVHRDYLPPPPYDKLFADPSYRGHFELTNWNQQTAFRIGMDPADFAYVLSQYDGDIAWVDSQIARIIAGLKESGDWPRTAVIVTADHGDELLDHGGRLHGHTLFTELLHVPLIVKVPGAPKPATVDDPVSLCDIFPTVMNWAGVSLADYRGPGRSLLPLIGGASGVADRPLFAETRFMDRFAPDATNGHGAAVQQGKWKYIERDEPPQRSMLFQIDIDPREQVDRAKDAPDTAAELQAVLHDHLRSNRALRDALRWAVDRLLDEKTTRQFKQLGYLN